MASQKTMMNVHGNTKDYVESDDNSYLEDTCVTGNDVKMSSMIEYPKIRWRRWKKEDGVEEKEGFLH